jgi:hypothetical protein
MNRMIVKSRVGADGVLTMRVVIGAANANRDVEVTIEPVAGLATTGEEWQKFLTSTAGAWQGEFECPDLSEYEKRDALS